MVESGKSFIKNVRREGRGGIYNNLEAEKQAVKQQRAEQLADTTTVNELGNTDTQATDGNTSVVGKVADKIVNSKIGQSILGVGEDILEGEKKAKSFLGKQIAKVEGYVAKEMGEEVLKEAKYKEVVGESSEDEMSALRQKVANVQGVGQEYAQQAKEAQERTVENMAKMMPTTARGIFKDYWQSADGNTTYLTNGKSILVQPSIQTIDWNSKLGQAYDTVGDVLQRENRLLSIEEFRSYFPEYDHIDDDTINFFMGGVANDVINRHEKTDIQTVANIMGSMSMVDGYTSKFDSTLDLFNDELFLKYGLPESARTDPKQRERLDAMDTLNTYADWLNERGANMYGLSKYTVLQTYRNQVPEIDAAFNVLEQYSEKETNKLMENYISGYQTNIENAEVDVERGMKRGNLLNEVNKDINDAIVEYVDSLVTKRAESIAETTQEYGTQNLRTIRRILYGKYYKDDNGNYYDLTGELMAYTKDGKTYSPDGKEINMGKYRIGLIRSLTNSLVGISQYATETIADVEKAKTGKEMGVSSDLERQYATEIVGDIVKTAFSTVMTVTPGGLKFQSLSQVPGGIGYGVEGLFSGISWMFGTIGTMLGNLTGFTDGFTEEGKRDFKETMTDFGWLLWGGARGKAKKALGKSKRYNAISKSIEAGVNKIVDGLKLNRTITLSEALKKGNIDMTKALELVEPTKKTEGKEGKTEIKTEVKTEEKPIEKIEPKVEQGYDTIKISKTLIQEAYQEMVDTYRKEMGISEPVQTKTENLVKSAEEQGVDATEVKQAVAKVDEAINKILEVTAKETGIEVPTTEEGVIKTMKDNFVEAVRNTEKTRAERKAEAKLDKQLKKSGFKDEEVTTLKENKYISVLNNVLENYIKEVYDAKKTRRRGKEVIEYTEKQGRSKPEIQDMIFDEWYKQTEELMKKLKEGISEMDASTYRILPKKEAYNLVPFWRDLGLGEGKIAEFIKRGDIEFYVDGGEIKARYAGDMRTMDVMVESAINILNAILKEYNKATDNGRHQLSEYDILNIRDRIKPYAESKDMQTSMIGMDLMKNFNSFLDNNNYAPILRGADKVRAEYNTIKELFDGILNENGEIKKQARNQMMKLDEEQIAQLESLGLMGTRELLDLAKNGPGIVAHITNQLTKLVWKHPGAANVAYYGALWSTIGVLPGVLGKVVGIPLGRRFGKRVQEKFFNKVPEKDVNQMFIDSLKLADEAKAKIESDKKTVEEATSKLLQKYKEMAEKGLEASKTSTAKENKGVPLTEATTITEPKTTVTDAEFVASLGELSTTIDVATERYAKTLEEETINYANNLIKELGEEGAKAKIEEELNKFKSELEKQFGEKIELPELTDEDVEIQKALDEQTAKELEQEGEKPQVVSSEEGKSEAGETKAEESLAESEKGMNLEQNKEEEMNDLMTKKYETAEDVRKAQIELTKRKNNNDTGIYKPEEVSRRINELNELRINLEEGGKKEELDYDLSKYDDRYQLQVHHGRRGYDTEDTPGAGEDIKFYTNNLDRALTYAKNGATQGDIDTEMFWVDTKDTKIIDSKGIAWNQYVDDNGNIVEGKTAKNGPHNYINYNNKIAKEEGKKVVIYKDIVDIGPFKPKGEIDVGGDDIVVLDPKILTEF